MKTPEIDKTAQEWRESAPYWRLHESTLRTMFTPMTEALIDAAEFAPGQRVLDIAGGPGEPSLRIASLVGPSGIVVHTDLALEMVLAARDEARELGLSNLRHALMAGQALAFRDRTFDRIASRMGFMFIPDPLQSAGRMLRAVRAGGRVVLVVWGSRETNPYFRIPGDIVARYFEAPPDPPDAPVAWRYAEPGKLANLFAAAGAANVTEKFFQFDITSELDFEKFWNARQQLSGSLREKLAGMTESMRETIHDETRDAMSEFFVTGSMRIPAEALVVTAHVG